MFDHERQGSLARSGNVSSSRSNSEVDKLEEDEFEFRANKSANGGNVFSAVVCQSARQDTPEFWTAANGTVVVLLVNLIGASSENERDCT